MRGKAGVIGLPSLLAATSTSSFATASGKGTPSAPLSVVLIGNGSPAVTRQASFTATTSGTLKFSNLFIGFSAQAELLINGEQEFTVETYSTTDDSYYAPISVVAGDVITLSDFFYTWEDEISGSFWIE